MVRKFLLQFMMALVGLAVVAGCSRPNGQSRISITFPQATLSSDQISQSVSAQTVTTKWGLSVPTSSSQLNCYAVALAAPTGNGHSCTNVSGTTVMQPSTIFGTFPAGSTQVLEVAPGNQRTIYLIGFKASNITDCKSISGTALSSLSPSVFSPPSILDQVTMNLTPGNVNVTLNVPSTMGSTTTFEDCAPFTFGAASSTALTVTGIVPTSGSTSGGTLVSIAGTGFDGSTSVEIGAAPCTVSSYTSTNITCTTTASSSGTYDVNVMRSPTTVALTSAFTYATPASLSFLIGSTYDFSNVNIGSSLSTFIVVENTGALSATSVSGSSLSGEFTYVGGSYPGTNGTCGTTIATGTCTIELNFAPTASGLRSDTVSLSYAGASSIFLNLEGTGVVAPTATLVISDGAIYDYGSVTTGNTQDHSFTITNTGTITATSMFGSGLASPYSFKGGVYPGTGGSCGNTLASGGSCTVVVTYAPLSISTDNDTIDILYYDGVGAVSASRNITGTGAAAPSFSITGVMGGTDSTVDNVLVNSEYAIVNWNDMVGETLYTITIFESDGISLRCGPVNISANGLDYDFAGCPLTYGNTYYVEVEATVSGSPVPASNSPYMFTVDFIPEVTAKYPTNGANWNDYISGTTDTACIAGSDTDCTNGGTLRKVDLPLEPSCTGLNITDFLNAFNWICSDISGHAIFYSTGLKENVGLGDLLNGSNFRSNYVTITGGIMTYTTSSSTPWWSNPIVLLGSNASTMSLPGSGTIYTYNTNITTAGFAIQSDKISIVGQSNAIISPNGTSTMNCNYATAGTSSADNLCMIASPGYNFLWVEGKYDGYHAVNPFTYGVTMYNTKFSRFNNLNVSNFNYGLNLMTSSRNTLTYVTASNNSNYGIKLNNGDYNRLESIYAHSNSISGVLLDTGSNYNYLYDLHVNNNGDGLTINNVSSYNKVRGVYAFNSNSYGLDVLGGSIDNSISDVAVSGGTYGGISISNANGLKLSNVTVANAGPTNYGGLRIYSGTGYVFRNILSLNNDWGVEIGISSGVVSSTTVANVAVGSPGVYAITHVGSSVDFKGIIKTDGSCFSNAAGLDNSCTPALGTQVVSSFSGASTLVGKVSADTNTTHTSGLGSYSTSALDWFQFNNVFRGWGLNGSAFPSSDNVGRCTSGSCRIWDLALPTTDTAALNITGNGTSSNGTYTAYAACPSAVNGSDTITHASSSETFLRNATEVIDPYDGSGDDDGLCETGETCIYNPNFGAYQGHGDYTASPCTFSDGTVSSVVMYAYPTNGY